MAQLTDEQRQRLADAMMNCWIAGARERDPDSASILLGYIVADLRSDAGLSDNTRAYLADALELAISEPKKAGQALGLIGKKARPKASASAERNKKIVRILELLKSQGFKPNSIRPGEDGVFAAVAKVVCVSKRTVERAWNAHTKQTNELRKLLAKDTK